MQLQTISNILPGYSFRGAITPDKNSDIFVFQAKDIVRGEPITSPAKLVPISSLVVRGSSYLKYNDIVIVARGLKAGAFRATTIRTKTQNIIASSSIHIIRLTNSSVESDYICNYLNSSSAQANLAKEVKGSYIGVLPRKALEQLDIPIPSIEKQKILIDLHANLLSQVQMSTRRNHVIHTMIDSIYKEI